MKVLVDMNLSPDWAPLLTREGWETIHWSSVGNPHATETDIMAWAAQKKFVVFTHDLDFGKMSHQTPSVLLSLERFVDFKAILRKAR